MKQWTKDLKNFWRVSFNLVRSYSRFVGTNAREMYLDCRLGLSRRQVVGDCSFAGASPADEETFPSCSLGGGFKCGGFKRKLQVDEVEAYRIQQRHPPNPLGSSTSLGSCTCGLFAFLVFFCGISITSKTVVTIGPPSQPNMRSTPDRPRRETTITALFYDVNKGITRLRASR